jgi:hypothetical protein
MEANHTRAIREVTVIFTTPDVTRRVADLARALLRRGSLVVIGGRHSWWPTRPERLRRTLEAQGHIVVFVNEAEHAA